MTHQPYNTMQSANGVSPEAGKAKTTSLVFGIIGLFIFGIILGPLAIMQANKAERFGARATAGKVLGIICTIVGIVGIIFAVLHFI